MWEKGKNLLGIIILCGIIVGSQLAADQLYDHYLKKTESVEETAVKAKDLKVVIDSGHGGSDPGKVGAGGTLEKNINLIIAKKIQERLEEQQVQVIMTKDSEASIAESKAEDMKKRVEIINNSQALLAISVHQNSYSDPAIHGAQTFYYEQSEKGKKLAEAIQESLLQIDPENHRQAKGNTTYYLLKKTQIPLVIIECGFLSNQEEEKALNTEEYQDKIAEAAVQGIMNYIQK